MANRPIHFNKSCLKTLTAVEANLAKSNQHEFQGVAALRELFGLNTYTYPATFSIRGDNQSYQTELTWYDARARNPERSAEYRLYFKSNKVMLIAKEGDSIVIGKDKNNNIHCELIPTGSLDHRYSKFWTDC
ncbi:MAG: type II restriction endonuclease [Gammaproteobacteria bacterium]|nr:type II restriction endonuclease [Gammaproteobacteria bacterium]